MRAFVAFEEHIQLTAVGEVFRASRHQISGPIASKPAVFGSRQSSDAGLHALPVAVRSTTEGRELNA